MPGQVALNRWDRDSQLVPGLILAIWSAKSWQPEGTCDGLIGVELPFLGTWIRTGVIGDSVGDWDCAGGVLCSGAGCDLMSIFWPFDGADIRSPKWT